VEFIIGKVLGDDGSGQYAWIVEGIHWALEQGADIISMSLGGPVGTPELEAAVNKAMKESILICAAGNAGSGGWWDNDTIGFPGAYPGVICVGSINSHKDRSQFSSIGKNLTVMAPGENILSCVPPDGYARYSGTSMATPFVAGVAALILAKHRKHGGKTPCEHQGEMYKHLTKVAVDMGDEGWDSYNGWGLINPAESLKDKDPTFAERLKTYLSVVDEGKE
jgi:subtilisin family serine protease